MFPSVIELSSLDGSTGFALNGAAAGDFSGRSVASAGDVNGDGIADLIVGAPYADPNGSFSGRSYVVFGSSGGFAPEVELSALDGATGFALNGEANSRGGYSVASAGDVNGDGIDDLIVGAHYAEPNGTLSGRSYVVLGSSGGFASEIELSTLDGVTGFAIDGAAAYDWSGHSVSSAGDVNGDGIDDLIIGAYHAANPYASIPDGTVSGRSYVVFGSSGGFGSKLELSSLDGATGFALNDVVAPYRSRFFVSSAGDVNADGIDDLIVGAPRADPNGSASGRSYVVFGSSGGFASEVELSSLDGATGFALNGAATYDRSGYSVASAGDVNGDGIDDLIVGASGADPNGSASGRSYVVFGSSGGFSLELELSMLDGTTGFVIDGAAAFDRSGVSVASAGDVNGDGFDDLIAGANGADPNGPSSGGGYVVFGSSGGFASEIELSALDATTGFALNGAAEFDQSGNSVAAAGDVNGDGIDDLIVGASGADPNGSSSGRSYVVFGRQTGAPPPTDEPTPRTVDLPLPFNSVGNEVLLTQSPDSLPTHMGLFKEGYDFDLAIGDLALAIVEGRIVHFRDDFPTIGRSASDVSGTGNYVTIVTNEGESDQFYVSYMHLAEGSVSEFIAQREGRADAILKVGEPIGRVGASGLAISTVGDGSHLHIQVGGSLHPGGSATYAVNAGDASDVVVRYPDPTGTAPYEGELVPTYVGTTRIVVPDPGDVEAAAGPELSARTVLVSFDGADYRVFAGKAPDQFLVTDDASGRVIIDPEVNARIFRAIDGARLADRMITGAELESAAEPIGRLIDRIDVLYGHDAILGVLGAIKGSLLSLFFSPGASASIAKSALLDLFKSTIVTELERYDTILYPRLLIQQSAEALEDARDIQQSIQNRLTNGLGFDLRELELFTESTLLAHAMFLEASRYLGEDELLNSDTLADVVRFVGDVLSPIVSLVANSPGSEGVKLAAETAELLGSLESVGKAALSSGSLVIDAWRGIFGDLFPFEIEYFSSENIDLVSEFFGQIGGPGPDTLVTSEGGSRVMAGGGGDDFLSGDTPSDIAFYKGTLSAYSFLEPTFNNFSASTFRIDGTPNQEGVDTLLNVELLAFGDGSIYRVEDLSPFGGTGNEASTSEILPPLPPSGPGAVIFGDPHLVTLDGLGYSFQAVGEFTLIEGTDPADDLLVQIRTAPVGQALSVISQMGMVVDGVRLTLDPTRAEPLALDGVATPFADGAAPLALGGAGELYRAGNQYVIVQPNGEQVRVTLFDDFLNVDVFLDQGRAAGSVRGLLGDADGDASDDLQLADGTVLPQPVDFAQLYSAYADAWRVEQASSLLDYGLGEDTTSFTDTSFPAAPVTLDDLPADLRQWALDQADAAGITDPIQRAFAALDLALTGDASFLDAAVASSADPSTETAPANAPAPAETLILSRTANDPAEGNAGATPVSFTLTRGGDLTGDLVVNWTASGTADLAAAASGTVTLGDGVATGSIVVEIASDTVPEADETLTVEVSTDPDVVVLAPRRTVHILNDDDFAPIAVDDVATVAEDDTTTGDVLANDSDPDPSDVLAVVSVGGSAANLGAPLAGDLGTLTLNADGSWSYAADRADALIAGETSTDVFVYALQGGPEATLTIEIAGSDETRKGGGGKDVLKGGGGDDKLVGRGGNDKLKGKGGDDVLKGNGGKDKLIGQGNDDRLKGGGGNDKLLGGTGDDMLQGQRGRDKLKSGGGEDTLRFKRGDGKDVILDWTDGEDVIHIQKGAKGFRQFEIYEKGKHALIDYGKRGDLIKLKNTDADDLDATDFLFG